MDASTVVTTLRSLSGMTRVEVARMAGLSPSTIGRIERRELDPSWSSMMTIVDSFGYTIADRLRSAGDPAAVAAARRAIEQRLQGEKSMHEAERESPWLNRWLRAGLIDASGALPGQAGRLALLAGSAASVLSRPGSVSFGYTQPWQETVGLLEDAGIRSAVTGIEAAAGRDPAAAIDWPVIYVAEPAEAGRAASLAPPLEGQRRITMLPFDATALADLRRSADARIAGAVMWVSPVQGLIDAYATPGRSADRADALASQFERHRLAAA